MKAKQAIDFSQYRHGLSPRDKQLLERVIRDMDDVKSLSKWCYYNVRWIRRYMAEGRKIA